MKSESQNGAESPMITLMVNDLPRQIQFYKEYIGLQLNWHDEYGAWLGVDQKDLIRLVKMENRLVLTKGQLALKLTSLCELSRVVARLCTVKIANEVVDHGFRQSTYLSDKEGNEIELYFESEDDHVDAESHPLDLEVLFNQLRPDDRLCDGLGKGTSTGNFFRQN